ncbi:GFA family protein [Caenispirillum salinarum]|uniref:GFA family protein n=1 Tax=Caenispirillum salinarum TaxID=859058 RepID=UPI00384F48E7
MHLEGSCHCGAVRFSVEAHAPVPYLRCHCSICRKTAGSGGYAINLGAKADTLTVDAEDGALGCYNARMEDGSVSSGERRFCTRCGTALWVFSPEWPHLIHPHAGGIDTPLPDPPEQVHIMLGSKANWVRDDSREGEARFEEYPDQSLDDWHRAHGLLSGDPPQG